jgi:hypothetical protein
MNLGRETMQLKECMVCKHINQATATMCQECSLPLYSEDETLPHHPPLAVPSYSTLELNEEQVALYGGNNRQICDFVSCGELILGRGDDTQFCPTLDLTPYNAHVLGVSRQHATITCHDGTFWITDLGSRYGTSINGQALKAHYTYELHNGDVIRLGELQIRVQFSRRAIAVY